MHRCVVLPKVVQLQDLLLAVPHAALLYRTNGWQAGGQGRDVGSKRPRGQGRGQKPVPHIAHLARLRSAYNTGDIDTVLLIVYRQMHVAFVFAVCLVSEMTVDSAAATININTPEY